MNRIIVCLSLAGVLAAGCNKEKAAKQGEVPTPQASGAATTAGQPPMAKPAEGPPGGADGASGKVLETMNSGGYTYVKINAGGAEIWAAGPETAVAVGDEVSFGAGAPMANYHSNTLDRTFELVYFVGSIDKGGAPAAGGAAPLGGAPAADPHGAAPAADPHGAAPVANPHGAAAPGAAKVEAVAKAEGGLSIEEVFAGKASLAGKTVMVRGHVVKFNAGIMGRNWLHLQDGTGAAGTNDLIVTTDETAAVGDVVTAKGTVAIDQDFGAGYSYALLVEKATLSK